MAEPRLEEQNSMFEVPHPYPAPEKAVGISVMGDGDLLPQDCWVQALRMESDQSQYEVVICAKMPSCYRTKPDTALRRINAVLTTLGLSALGDLVSQQDGVYRELATTRLSRGEECVVHYQTTRETFETIYRAIATSDYVQLSRHANVGYVIGELDEAEQQRFRWLHQAMFDREEPIVARLTRKPESNHPEPPQIFPILGRDLALVGIMSQSPLRIVSISEIDGVAHCTADLSTPGKWG